MDKDVLITIGGILTVKDGEDNVDMVVPGQYYRREDRHYLFYEEVLEGMEEMGAANSCRLMISYGDACLKKSGLVRTEMVFRLHEETSAQYVTPYGTIGMGITAHRIRIRETEECITAMIDYTLAVDGEAMSENYLRIEVRPRGGDLKLR